MNELFFLVRGSSGNTYEVIARKIGSVFTITCTCEAGSNGLQCKHRTGLIDGQPEWLESPNASDLPFLKEMISGSKFELALADLAKAEKALSDAKKSVTAAKRRVGAAMLGR